MVKWYNSGDHRSAGNACLSAAFELSRGASYKDSGKRNAAGCGTAMRVAPIGLIYSGNDLIQHSHEQSDITHKDKRASIGAIVTAYCINLLIDEKSIEKDNFLAEIIHYTERIENGFKRHKHEFTVKMKLFPELFN